MLLPYSWIISRRLCLWITCVSRLRMLVVRKRASSYSKYLGLPMVICHKSRLRANEVAEMRIIGDVTGLDVLLVDDMVDTAGTITKAANLMLENGAKSVRAIASHAVMSDPASTRVDQSALAEMIFTDSIPYAKKCEK